MTTTQLSLTNPAPDSGVTNSRERPLSVADVLRLAKTVLDRVGVIWLEAEIAQVSIPSSGHLYLSVRDKEAVMPAVMWARDAQQLKFRIETGQRLRLRGRLSVYDRDGKMQLYVDYAEPAGVGESALALAQLKKKLSDEGLFASERKRALPRFPKKIGVVTSKTGAAVHDIIRTVNRRYPTPIAIADCMVQGAQAPAQIVDALVLAVAAGCDVIILGRGGGAATDLSAFNHERVVRTVARCPVPIISAVGHEVDLTLCDLAADARASTPTAAAELAVPVADEIREVLEKEWRRLDREMRVLLDGARQEMDHQTASLLRGAERAIAEQSSKLGQLLRHLTAQHPRTRLLAQQAQLAQLERRLLGAGPQVALVRNQHQLRGLTTRLTKQTPATRMARGQADMQQLSQRADAAVQRKIDAASARFRSNIASLQALSPLAVMSRGYAMVKMGDTIVRSSDMMNIGDTIDVQLGSGSLQASVTACLPPVAATVNKEES
jgi:exodeoxyribonuclease VII large subunit